MPVKLLNTKATLSISNDCVAMGSSTSAPISIKAGLKATVKARAQLGGCKQRSASILLMAAKTTIGARTIGSPMYIAHTIPTQVDNRLPAKIDQGCANGVAEVINNKTADAPIGAARLNAIWLPNSQ